MRGSFTILTLILLCLNQSQFLSATSFATTDAFCQDTQDTDRFIDIMWEKTNGPYGGDVRSIAINNLGQIFATTLGDGVYRSTNNGDTWTSMSFGIANLNTQAIAAGLGILLVGTDGGGIFISRDNGEHWSAANNEITTGGIGALFVDAKGVIYAGSLEDGGSKGIFRSIDTAKTWMLTSVQNGSIRSFAAAPNGNIFAAGEYGVYRSSDDGATWTSVTKSSSRSVAVTNNGVIYAAHSGSLERSFDNGNSWLSSVLNGEIVAVATDSLGRIFAGRWGDGILTSTDGGSTWTTWNTGLSRIYCILPSTDSTVLAGTWGNGVVLSTNSGKSWSKSSVGLSAIVSFSLATSSTDDIIVGTYGAGIFRSTDYGGTWEQTWIGSGFSDVCNVVMRTASGLFYAGTNAGLLLSTTSGKSWIPLTAPTLPSAIGYKKDGIMFFGGFGNAYKSTDYGASWNPTLSFGSGFARGIIFDSNDHVIIGTEAGTFHSTNDGITWDLTDGGSAQCVLVDNQKNIFVAGDHFINRSQDDCKTWKSVSSIAIFGMSLFGNTIYASGNGVHISTNNGDIWIGANNGLKNTFIYATAFDQQGYLYASSPGGGIYRSSQKIAKVDRITESKTTFSLEQNFPNPFNPSTMISFGLPQKSFVSLKVYDVLGKEVMTIISEELSAGNYSRQWTASSLPSGIYYYRLQSGLFSETKKLILLK